MGNIKKEFTPFEEYLKTYMKIIKIRNINYQYNSKINSHDYDNYTIEQFVILYKLNRMKDLGVVSDTIANNLKEIFDMKIKIDTMIGEETEKRLYGYSYDPNKLSELHKTSDTINNHLKKYHLTVDDISLVEMIDAIIKEENSELIKEDKNIRIKRMD